MFMRTVTLADRPDLGACLPEVLAARWPRFMLAGHPGHDVDLVQHLTVKAPQHQVILLDRDDEILGVGLSVPLEWDGTVAGLPAGWDAAVSASAELLASGRTLTMVSALSVTLARQASGRGLAEMVIAAMRAAAIGAGAPGMLVPVRPVWKSRYPLIPLADYAGWRRPDGEVFDPWLRLHLQLGARRLAIAESSLTVTGTVREWEDWIGLPLPGTGAYTIDGGLVPLHIDYATQRGVYVEPNVWVYHAPPDNAAPSETTGRS
jgi:hypothetical protein